MCVDNIRTSTRLHIKVPGGVTDEVFIDVHTFLASRGKVTESQRSDRYDPSLIIVQFDHEQDERELIEALQMELRTNQGVDTNVEIQPPRTAG